MPAQGDVIVVGGAGAVGSMFVDLLRDDGRSVTVLDRTRGSDLVGDISCPDGPVRGALAQAELIVLAVAEQTALAALPTLTRAARADTLIVDTLSVKSRIAVAVEESGRAGEFLGLNPMFRPSLGPRGRAVIAVPYVDGPRCREFLDEVRSWGASTPVMDPDRHDRLAAATQALTHASVLAFGLALTELDVAPELALDVGPPPHRTLSALLARIVTGEPEVYWDVQSGNPYAATARKALTAAAARLETATGNFDDFSDLVASAAGALGNQSEELNEVAATLFEDLGSHEAERNRE